MTRISGATAVVTGAASGIGRGIAEALIARGARVAIADVERDAADRTAAEIGAIPLWVDVTSLESVEQMRDAALSAMGSVQIVVNNAGIGPFASLSDLSMADWRWMIDVNLYGVIHGVHAFLPLLESAGGGHIVNTASMAALAPLPMLGSYAVTKFGVAALTEVLSAELEEAGSGVKTTLLLPGAVRTNISQSLRNRPDGAEGALADEAIDLDFSGSVRWLEPRDVGEITARAIEANELFAVTHPERWPQVRRRFERIEAAFNRAAASEAEAQREG